ncbi:hypothetical protein [Chondromyces apiculatus]|nr:hypothetical protein [Chondromyces apiculatus]
MRKHSDAELLDIVTKQRDDYVPEALAAADAELARRSLSPKQVARAEEDLGLKQRDKEQRASMPLGFGWKLVFLACPGLLTLMFAGSFKADGYTRKYREAWQCTAIGLGIYVALIVSCSALSAPLPR